MRKRIGAFLLSLLMTSLLSAQEDNAPLRDRLGRLEEAQGNAIWDFVDSPNGTVFIAYDRDTHAVLGTASLPFRHMGCVVDIRRMTQGVGTGTWRLLVAGLTCTFDANPFPSSYAAKLCWIDIALSSAPIVYSLSLHSSATYSGRDFGSAWADTGGATGTYFLDIMRRELLHAQWTPNHQVPDFPPENSLTAIPVGATCNGWLMESDSVAIGGRKVSIEYTDDSHIELQTIASPYELVRLQKTGGVWSDGTPRLLEEFMGYSPLVTDGRRLGGFSGMRVILPPLLGASASVVVKDDLGGVMYGPQNLATGGPVLLPAIAGLNSRPGAVHTLEATSSGNEVFSSPFVPGVRYGVPSSFPSFSLGRGVYSYPQAAPGNVLAGAHVRSTLAPTAPLDVYVLLALNARDGQGADPVVEVLPGVYLLDLSSPLVTAINLGMGVPAARIGSSVGIKLEVPVGLGGMVQLYQVVFGMSGVFAVSDVFGYVMTDPVEQSGLSSPQASLGLASRGVICNGQQIDRATMSVAGRAALRQQLVRSFGR